MLDKADVIFYQVAALPTEASLPYAEALTVLEFAPLNGWPYDRSS